MGKYSLIALNRTTKMPHTINVYDLERKEYKDKVHIKDIDVFTSAFKGTIDFIRYLKENKIIDFDDVSFYIVSKYKNTDFHYRAIFDSKMINEIAKTVNGGSVNATKEAYIELSNYFYRHLKEEKFKESIENAKTITPSVKTDMIHYIELINKDKTREEDLEQERILKMRINEELKRYKTFRGFYLFVEEYKRYGYVAKPRERDEVKTNNEASQQIGINQTTIFKPAFDYKYEKRIDTAYDYNIEHEEFITDEEYEGMVGEGNATQYIKGARHDKYTK